MTGDGSAAGTKQPGGRWQPEPSRRSHAQLAHFPGIVALLTVTDCKQARPTAWLRTDPLLSAPDPLLCGILGMLEPKPSPP
jgi:hypothetical protein